MTRADINIRVRKVLTRYLEGPITDDRVIGRIFIENEDLKFELWDIGISMFVDTRSTTFAQLVKDLEYEWDKLADWERRNLATK